ncbi:MAG TPA: hypothetical protein VGE79_06425, partial [Niastella sp.]
VAGSRFQGAGYKLQVTGEAVEKLLPVTRRRLPGNTNTGYRLQVTGCRLQGRPLKNCYRLPGAGYRGIQNTGFRCKEYRFTEHRKCGFEACY